MSNRKSWTEHDIALIIKAMDNKKTYQQIADLFPDRTYESVVIKLKRLKKQVANKSYQIVEYWTDDEVNLLIQKYNEGRKAEEIAQLIKRPVTGVYKKNIFST